MTIESDDGFLADAEARLRRALAGTVPAPIIDDCVQTALLWAIENAEKLEGMRNPIGYLYRVATTHRTRSLRRPPKLPTVAVGAIADFEPGLVQHWGDCPTSKEQLFGWFTDVGSLGQTLQKPWE